MMNFDGQAELGAIVKIRQAITALTFTAGAVDREQGVARARARELDKKKKKPAVVGPEKAGLGRELREPEKSKILEY